MITTVQRYKRSFQFYMSNTLLKVPILLLELHVVLISLITLNIFVIENSFIEKGK